MPLLKNSKLSTAMNGFKKKRIAPADSPLKNNQHFSSDFAL